MKTEIDYKAKSDELEKELITVKKRTLKYIRLIKEMNNQTSVSDQSSALSAEEKSQLLSKLSKVERRLEITERKLSAMQNSTLGKLTLKYWNFRKRFRRGV